jgi:hypothetical protein
MNETRTTGARSLLVHWLFVLLSQYAPRRRRTRPFERLLFWPLLGCRGVCMVVLLKVKMKQEV